jgi:hypothetical protein
VDSLGHGPINPIQIPLTSEGRPHRRFSSPSEKGQLETSRAVAAPVTIDIPEHIAAACDGLARRGKGRRPDSSLRPGSGHFTKSRRTHASDQKAVLA